MDHTKESKPLKKKKKNLYVRQIIVRLICVDVLDEFNPSTEHICFIFMPHLAQRLNDTDDQYLVSLIHDALLRADVLLANWVFHISMCPLDTLPNMKYK